MADEPLVVEFEVGVSPAAGPPRRERTGQVWGGLTAAYARACAGARD